MLFERHGFLLQMICRDYAGKQTEHIMAYYCDPRENTCGCCSSSEGTPTTVQPSNPGPDFSSSSATSASATNQPNTNTNMNSNPLTNGFNAPQNFPTQPAFGYNQNLGSAGTAPSSNTNMGGIPSYSNNMGNAGAIPSNANMGNFGGIPSNANTMDSYGGSNFGTNFPAQPSFGGGADFQNSMNSYPAATNQPNGGYYPSTYGNGGAAGGGNTMMTGNAMMGGGY